MRLATDRAAMRRGWVCAMLRRPSSYAILGICVVLPDPVSPATTTTWWSPIAASSSSRCCVTGSSGGYSTRGTAARRRSTRDVASRPTIGRRKKRDGPLSCALPVLPRLPAVHQHDGLLEDLGRPRAVREHVRLALRAQPGDEDRLGLAVLLDPLGAVADADTGLADAAE